MTRFRFALLFLALTGLFVAALGVQLYLMELDTISEQTIREALRKEHGEIARTAVIQVMAGLGVAAVLFVLSLLLTVGGSAGRRSAFGMNVLVQVTLAAILLVGVNVFSFRHYAR